MKENSLINNTDKYDPPITDKPYILPLAGFISGIAIWILDAAVDIYILGEEQTLIENIINPEVTEFWMRSLVLFVLLMMGIFARKAIIKHIELDKTLLNHKRDLENQVMERTKELQIKTEKMIILANQDPLTGLSNRRKFSELLEQEYNRFTRHNVPFCIIMIDIDFFKKINDQYGHDIGDQVLIRFSQTIKNSIRKTDEIARWGGEEFIILAIETNDINVKVLANNIRTSIKSTAHDKAGHITASIGITCSHQHDRLPDII
ncbi:MAG: diguanylate cyclase, partial [Gammaproteobacteria bacterium]|nr:diguanylate cyclase [Gammaproteobacteria bacterium]